MVPVNSLGIVVSFTTTSSTLNSDSLITTQACPHPNLSPMVANGGDVVLVVLHLMP